MMAPIMFFIFFDISIYGTFTQVHPITPKGEALPLFLYPSTTVPGGELSPDTQGRSAFPAVSFPGPMGAGCPMFCATALAGPPAWTAADCAPPGPAGFERSIRSSILREIC